MVLLLFEILIVWMRQVLQLLVDCGGAEYLLPAAMQPLIQTQRRQVTMNALPWLFKAKSSWGWEEKNKIMGSNQADRCNCVVFYLEDVAVGYFR